MSLEQVLQSSKNKRNKNKDGFKIQIKDLSSIRIK